MFPGKDLWILPPPSHSRWVARVDWYLNWQICKGILHAAASVADRLQKLAQEYEVDVPGRFGGAALDVAPLLISSRGLIPAARAVVLGQPEERWLARAKAVAVGLGATEISVFLPRAALRDRAEAEWLRLPGHCEAHFVEEEEEVP